ncbi:MAG: RebB family R body protein [Deltaproteobacteria bacterium]|nr:RebB family R body protein [Deltaproteobacteria bacterium]
MSTPAGSSGLAAATRSVNDVNKGVVGTAPSEAQAITYESLAHSLTLLMHNAAQTQFGAKQIQVAAVAAVCSQIVRAGTSSSSRL